MTPIPATGIWKRFASMRRFSLYRAVNVEQMSVRHIAFFTGFALTASKHLHGPQQKTWLDRLDAEHSNFRAALSWSLGADGDPGLGLSLAIALWQFWRMRGNQNEGRQWFVVLLERSGSAVDPILRARALFAYASLGTVYFGLAGYHSDAPAQLEQALDTFRAHQLDDGIALCQFELGSIVGSPNNHAADFERAKLLLNESIAHSRRVPKHEWLENQAWFVLANVAYWQADFAKSESLFEQCQALARQHGDALMLAVSLTELSDVVAGQLNFVRAAAISNDAVTLLRDLNAIESFEQALLRHAGQLLHLGEFEQARKFADEAVQLCLAHNVGEGLGGVYVILGLIAREQLKIAEAQRHFRQALDIYTKNASKSTSWGGLAILGLASLASLRGQHERAALLYGALEVWQRRLNLLAQPDQRIKWITHIDATRKALGDAEYAAVFARGQALTLSQAHALSNAGPTE